MPQPHLVTGYESHERHMSRVTVKANIFIHCYYYYYYYSVHFEPLGAAVDEVTNCRVSGFIPCSSCSHGSLLRHKTEPQLTQAPEKWQLLCHPEFPHRVHKKIILAPCNRCVLIVSLLKEVYTLSSTLFSIRVTNKEI